MHEFSYFGLAHASFDRAPSPLAFVAVTTLQ
jgi:hypothetical protein